MKKEIHSKLKTIAIQILSFEDEIDVEKLKKQTIEIYDSLCVLAHSENSSPQIEQKQEIPKPIITLEEPVVEATETHETLIETTTVTEESLLEQVEKLQEKPKEESPNLLYELDELTAGFENLPEFEPANKQSNSSFQLNVEEDKTPQKINEMVAPTKTSVNESLKKTIQIGLNDRIAFVSHLFGGNQEDYTRVISQLNTLNSTQEATNFINQIVKPEYNNWEGKETIEERFINAVFCKFEA